MLQVPNIFEIATSELSQDAFIAWISQWSAPELKSINEQLFCCACSFVKEIASLPDDYTILKIEAGRQLNNIDVWLKINGEIFVIIEDKKGTDIHSHQLNRYKTIAIEKFGSKMEIRGVFYKMEEQGDYQKIIDAGFTIISRNNIIPIFEKYSNAANNNNGVDLVLNYYNYLKRLDKDINSYKSLLLNDWHRFSWKGFYFDLQKELGVGNWNYVANKAGGFLGFWWFWKSKTHDESEFEFYLQIEQNKLVCKLHVYDGGDRYKIRDIYRKVLFSAASKLQLPIKRYGRIGKYMGIALIDEEWRKTSSGKLNMKETIMCLRKYEQLMCEVDSILGKEMMCD